MHDAWDTLQVVSHHWLNNACYDASWETLHGLYSERQRRLCTVAEYRWRSHDCSVTPAVSESTDEDKRPHQMVSEPVDELA